MGYAMQALAVLRHLRPRVPDADLLLVLTTPFIQGAVLQGLSVLRLLSAFEWQAVGSADRAKALVAGSASIPMRWNRWCWESMPAIPAR